MILAHKEVDIYTHAATSEDFLLAAAPDKKGIRRFNMLAYNGGAMTLGGHRQPIVIDLAGISFASEKIPILKDHDPKIVIGHTESISAGRSALRASGSISGVNDAVSEVIQSSDNGYPWQASIGATATKWHEVTAGNVIAVNGRDFVGPLWVARKSQLREISFVALGADAETSVNIAASFGRTGDSSMSGTITSRMAGQRVIEAAIYISAGGRNAEKHFQPHTLEAADEWRGIGLQQVLLMAAQANGMQDTPTTIKQGDLQAVMYHALEASSTVSIPSILSNVANKILLDGYADEDQSWREIAAIRPVADFRQATSMRLLSNGEFEKVGPSGEVKSGSLSDESFPHQADTYAKSLAIGRTQIINDDLDVFSAIRVLLGRGASQALSNVFWAKFMSNVGTLFTAGQGNYISGGTSNLGSDGVGLGLGLTAFRNLRTPVADGEKRITGEPATLLVPPELEGIANGLFVARNLGNLATVDGNAFAGKYRPVTSPWLSDPDFTGYSVKAWYLFRKPTVHAPMIVSFLRGQETPRVDVTTQDFSKLGIQFRGVWDFGCDPGEPMAGVMSKGEA